MTPRNTPCDSCPYRQDCPSGVWHEAEYVKLPEYDNDTARQPIGVFMCHGDTMLGTVCRGWLDTHDKQELLSLRLAVSFGKLPGSIFKLPPSGVPVFPTGAAAAEHGLRELNGPGSKAMSIIEKIKQRKSKHGG